MRKCMQCGYETMGGVWTIVYDPKRPKGAKKKNYIIGYLCEKCDP